jgi:hypothetical protein
MLTKARKHGRQAYTAIYLDESRCRRKSNHMPARKNKIPGGPRRRTSKM